MKYIIFLLLLISLIILYLYFDKKIVLMKKQLMITSNQYNSMKNKYDSQKCNIKNLSVKFIIPSYKTGIINTGSKIYMSPLLSSQVLKKADIRMEVTILDSAEISSERWYYVNLPIDTPINCRGWVNSKDISTFYGNSPSLDKLR